MVRVVKALHVAITPAKFGKSLREKGQGQGGHYCRDFAHTIPMPSTFSSIGSHEEHLSAHSDPMTKYWPGLIEDRTGT